MVTERKNAFNAFISRLNIEEKIISASEDRLIKI